jgi:hypothetical protein
MAMAMRDRDDHDTWNTFLFHRGVTIAHELTHCFIRYLSPNENVRTPIKVSFLNFGRDSQGEGESGWAMESRLLGGGMRCYEDRSDPLGPRQAGDLWLVCRDSYAYKISPKCIRNVVERRGTYNIIPIHWSSFIYQVLICHEFDKTLTTSFPSPWSESLRMTTVTPCSGCG